MQKKWMALFASFLWLNSCGSSPDLSSIGPKPGEDQPHENPSLELLSPDEQFVSPGETAELSVQFEAGDAPLQNIELAQNGIILAGYPRALTADELSSNQALLPTLPSPLEANHHEEINYTIRIEDKLGQTASAEAKLVTVLPLYSIRGANLKYGLIDIKQGKIQIPPTYTENIYSYECNNKTCYQACNYGPQANYYGYACFLANWQAQPLTTP